MDSTWIGVIGGLSGVLLGSSLSELLRRANRIEDYASRVFEKRLQVHEKLFAKLVEAQNVAEEVIQEGKHSAEDRHAAISVIVLDLAEYCDTNALYLHEELTLHCVGAMMGVEDVAGITDAKERENATRRVRSDLGNAKKMIRASSGIARIDKFFGKLTRAKLSSPVIEYYQNISKQRRH